MTSPATEPSPTIMRRDLATAIIAGATVLALLYFGREVLVPITLALILSLVVAPLVRALRHTGLRQVPAVLVASGALAVVLIALVVTIGLQMVQIASSLPQYESTIRAKVKIVRELTVSRMESLAGQAREVGNRLGEQPPAESDRAAATRPELPHTPGVVPVEIHQPPSSAFQVVGRVFGSIWVPVQTAGIVLVVLLFVLLEHDSLRDRFIRLAGGSDLRATTMAINDAGTRLSRFFVSQFAVNFAVGAVVWAGLALISVPHAALWGVLSAVLRFVPYVGVIAASLFAGLLAAAVDPGWSLMLMTFALFAVIELVVTQVVEPQLYGHTTGLSPLSVVVAAIFWSWLWGPVGLIVSTPLTLCLVVAGRHVKALGFLDVLLGDAPALTMPQRFYQRALSGDSDEIIAAARVFLKRRPFAAYCDLVLIRALHLARLDLTAGAIAPEQQHKVRSAIVRVVEAIGSETGPRRRRPPRGAVLDDVNAGVQLRLRREAVSGHWQGPLAAPPGSVAICIGLGTMGNDLATELLVRVLRDLHIDARHLSLEDFGEAPPPGATPGSVALVCIVSVNPAQEAEHRRTVAADMRRRFVNARIMVLLLAVSLPDEEALLAAEDADLAAESFEEAAQQALLRFRAQPQA